VYLTNAFVTAGNISQVFHDVFFPWPANIDTVSHPVKVNHSGSALHTSSPKASA